MSDKTPSAKVRARLNGARMRTVMAHCPGCKEVATIDVIGAAMVPTRKFRQVGGKVFHDCGSELPCRLVEAD